MPCNDSSITADMLAAMKKRLIVKRDRLRSEGQDTSEIDAFLAHIEEHEREASDGGGKDEDYITVEDPTQPDTDAKKKKRAKRELEREILAT